MNENKFTLKFADEAINDVNEAVRWYENKVSGLGEEFVIDFNNTCLSIQLQPEAFSRYTKWSKIRRKIFSVFPYKVFYLIENSEIKVLAVIHNSRSSRYIKNKLNR